MKRIIILGLAAMPFFFASCGGAENAGETTDTDSVMVEEEVIEAVVTNYAVDSTNTVINWNNFSEEEVDHQGTVKVLDGSVEITTTGEEMQITAASLNVDMNSISEGSEKLEGHLKAPDFFDVNQFATTSFTFDRHEGDMIYGTASIIGKDVPVEAPVTVMNEEGMVTIAVGEFKLDFAALEMPFFVTEAAEAPVEERHDSSIAFSATIVAK